MPTFRLDGVIGEDFHAADLNAFLEAANGNPVDIAINSPGGSVFEALAAYNALAEYTGVVTTTVDALAASAASVVFMAGTRRVMLEGSMLMLHRASGLTAGNKNDHAKTAEVLAKIDQQVINIYARVSGLPVNRITAMLDEETWLDANAARSNGFATEASVEAVSAHIAAFLDQLTHFRNTPATVLAMAKESPKMPTPNPAPANPAPAAPADVTAAILERGVAAGLDAVAINGIVAKAKGSLDTARDLIIDAVAAKAGDQRHGQGGSLDEPDTLAVAVQDVLTARMSGKPPADGPARELMGRSLLDLGAMVLQASGGKIRSWNRDKLAEQIMMAAGPNSTSDFPFLTLGAGQRILLDAYTASASPLKQIARRRSAQDFRSIAVGRLGEMPALLEVKEGAEVTYGSRTEASEAFKLRTWARIFALTRNAILSDDLSAFADSARAWGVAAATVEADQLYSLISGNGAVLSDGEPLWDATHGNVADGGTELDVDGLSAGRQSIRETKGIDRTTPLSIAPAFLLCGPANETQAEKVLASITAAQVQNVNPFAGKLTLLVEPRVTDYAWHLFADPAQAEILSYANLGDATGPELSTRDGWTVLGQEYRAVLDFGCGVTGFRGAYKNAGAAPSED
jgi:ATP-dependent protease ClpP protease subunit/phage major head subunit gpT-like protein